MFGRGRARIEGVAKLLVVGSGKGGVGKSTVAVNLAVALARTGARVGLLDADVYGPTIPGLLGATGAPQVTTLPNGQEALVPIEAHGLRIMSMAFFLPNDPSQPLIWRGPMVHSGIRQMIGQTAWGDLDYLLVDMPPGTGDATLTLA